MWSVATVGTVLVALTDASSPLVQALDQDVPFFRLDAHDGLGRTASSWRFSCFAVTPSPVAMMWTVNGEFHDSVLSTDDALNLGDKTVHVRYSTAVVKNVTAVTRINCVIRLYTEGDEKPSGGVTLQADAGRSTDGPLHLTLGAPCAMNRWARCVTEDSDCDRTRNPAVCTCREGYRFISETGMCLELQKHMGRCVLKQRCAQSSEVCRNGRCRCRPRFVKVDGACKANVSLGNVCDEHRLCPEGSACRSSACVCRDGYYIVNGHCVPGQTSKWPSVRASSMAKLVLSLCYSIAVIALGVWLYHHSHSPSLVYERSVTTWEFLPKMEH
ncbi:hypothetical protein HPB47_027947 [Ixodes persulcatus]|uniref:Uncharacterized protein n=1 Tax=Ixodes persulcatus TaxID=34615 RepID=A0AC60PWF9_IXOPE|nr:hypothetical protein HPB47_027947 [Ixodes persulcatus]